MWKIGITAVTAASGIGYAYSKLSASEEDFKLHEDNHNAPPASGGNPAAAGGPVADSLSTSGAIVPHNVSMTTQTSQTGAKSASSRPYEVNTEDPKITGPPINPARYGLPGDANVVKRASYIASLDYRFKIPHWVLQHLTKDYVETATATRDKCSFKADPSVEKPYRATLNDYRFSGYSRGHLAPAGDNKFNKSCMSDTFLLSANIVPQEMSMNGGDWLRLERMTRKLTEKYDDVYAVSGPCFYPVRDRDGKMVIPIEVIGPNSVAVPTHLFKVVMTENRGGKDRAIAAFVMRNGPIPGNEPLYRFQVPLSELERNTGLKFFPEIDRSTLVTDVCVATGCDVKADQRILSWKNLGLLKIADSEQELNSIWEKCEEQGFEAKWLRNMYRQEYTKRLGYLKAQAEGADSA